MSAKPFFAIGASAYGIAAAVDWDYYTTTISGPSKLLGIVVAIVASAISLWRMWLGPWARGAVAWFDEKYFAPSRETKKKIDEIAAGNEERTSRINRLAEKQDQTIAKVDAMAIAVARVAARQSADLKNDDRNVVETDAIGEVTYVSHGYTKLTGLDTHAAKFRGWKQAVHPLDRARVEREWFDGVKAERHIIVRFRIIRRDLGRMWHIESVAETMRTPPIANYDEVPKLAGWQSILTILDDDIEQGVPLNESAADPYADR